MNQIIATLGFPLITIVFYWLALVELRKALQKTSFEEAKQKRIFRRVIISLCIWAVAVSAWSLSGMMQKFSLFPLNFMPVLAIPMITVVVILFSKTTREILEQVGLQSVVAIQSFRFFVEVVMWLLFVENQLPVQMTFEGRNFDILAGLTGAIVAWLISIQKVNKWMLVIWNIACLGLLVNIVAVAILSMPTPIQQFFNEPIPTLVAKFPYAFLPAFLVPLAYMLHFFSLRQLLTKRSPDVSEARLVR
ncbi:hypothetical protein WSM22_00860 [Cytophagales bacterium WSM2-2]|nr:hypothetical protein WSM22_00860 [Cytophagales bacterium WSM2-2]